MLLPDGRITQGEHGRHLHLNVRPEAPVRILLTGHMDTVFAVDHPFQMLEWLEEGMLNGPGVADMKGGLALMLAALTAFETSRSAEHTSELQSLMRISYAVVCMKIKQDYREHTKV